jgi:hypothetical protein
LKIHKLTTYNIFPLYSIKRQKKQILPTIHLLGDACENKIIKKVWYIFRYWWRGIRSAGAFMAGAHSLEYDAGRGTLLRAVFADCRKAGFTLYCIQGGTCAIGVTAVELIFGVIFNIILKMRVWDYSHLPFNLFGQICPLYTLLWAGLALILLPFVDLINKKIKV